MQGDDDRIEAAFDELFTVAYRMAYRIVGDVGSAEDIAAEAIARAVVHWSRLSQRPERVAWVARVASNLAIDAIRRRERQVDHRRVAPGDQSETAMLRLALGTALGGLSKRQREVVALRYLADLPEAEVATSLGLSVNTVKKHTRRGIAALRETLGPTWEVDAAPER